MDVHDVTHNYPISLANDDTRTPGVHVSDVIRSIAVKIGKLKEYEAEELADIEVRFPADAQSTLRIALGLAWENWIASALPWIEFHFGEVQLEGIFMTPDGISDVIGIDRNTHSYLHEFKLTWKSSKRDIRDEWYWLSQVMAYLKKMKLRAAVVHIYYVNGNYRGSGPQRRSYHLVFTQAEIDANWTMIMHEANTNPKFSEKLRGK